MTSTLLVVPFVVVPLLKHAELAVNCFCDLVCVFQQGVPSLLEIFQVMSENDV